MSEPRQHWVAGIPTYDGLESPALLSAEEHNGGIHDRDRLTDHTGSADLDRMAEDFEDVARTTGAAT